MNNSVKAKKEFTKNESTEADDAVMKTAARDAKRLKSLTMSKMMEAKKPKLVCKVMILAPEVVPIHKSSS